MRGKVSNGKHVMPNIRITPAYAGKRLLRDLAIAAFQDHPRLCGEKGNLVLRGLMVLGSPPPMRGKGGDR